jgi:hypothetical protein
MLDNFWNSDGPAPGTWSERLLCWFFPSHIVNMGDFEYRYADGNPVQTPGDPNVEFGAPWILAYAWRPSP